MIIDVHGHLGNINLAPFWQADAPTLERYCREAGVDTLCVSSSRALMYDISEGNRELDEALRRTEKLLGYVVVSPTFPDSEMELKLLDANQKFRGVKMHPDYHGYVLGTRSNREFAEHIADRTKLVLFHVSCMPGSGFANALTVAEVARHHPKTNFVLAHMAGVYQNGNYPYFPNLDALEAVAALGLDNVYIDTAHYLMYVYPGVMEKMVAVAGAEHIVFGTDAPLQAPMQMRFAIDTIRALAIPEAEKTLILSGNARKILAIPAV